MHNPKIPFASLDLCCLLKYFLPYFLWNFYPHHFPTRNAFIFLLEHFLQTRPFFGAQCSFVSHAPFCIWSTNHTNGARIFGVCAPFGAYIIKLEHLFYLGMKVENWICLLSSNQSSSLYPINQWECLKLPLHWTHVHNTVST